MKTGGIYSFNLNVFLLNVFLFTWIAGHTQAFKWTDKLPADTSIIAGQLDNGIRYFIQHNNEPRNRAVLRLIIKTGSLQEDDDQLGVAHFVEHMAFNGTRHFEKNDIIHFIERNGSRFGADLNAYTSFDETVYKLQLQTDALSTIDTALLILEDWAGGISFDADDIAPERGVIIAEWRNRLSSRQRIQQKTYDHLYGATRYGKRLPIGNPELIDTVSRQRLLDYYQKWYQPHRMSIIAVGDFDREWMENEIKQRFSTLKNTDSTTTIDYPLKETNKHDFALITDPEAPFTQWNIYYQLERKTKTPPTIGTIREELLYTLYSAMLNKRLVEIKEQGNAGFTFAHAGFSELTGGYRSYQMGAFTKAEKLIPSLKTILTESRRAALHGFTLSEFDRQKTTYEENLKQMLRELDKTSSSAIASRIQREIDNGGFPADPRKRPAIIRMCLDDITLDDIHKAGSYWQNSQLQNILITTGTQQAFLLPDSLAFYRLRDSLLELSPLPFQDNAPSGPLVRPKTAWGSSVFIQKDSLVGLSEYRLSNGIKIYLKSTDFQNDEIYFNAFSAGGRSLYADEDYINCKHLLAVLRQSGLGRFNKSELSKMLVGKQLGIRPYLSEYGEGLSGQSNQKDLHILFQLIHLYFTQPRFDTTALENYKTDQQYIFNNIDTDPRSAFGRMLLDIKYENHLRRPTTLATEFDAIELEKLSLIFKERFEDANDFTFVFVGNIKEDSLLLLAEKYLAGLPVKIDEEHWRDRGLRLADYPIDTLVMAGQTPKSDVLLEWHSPFPNDDAQERYVYYALRQLISTKLREKLREEMGNVYGVRVSMSTYSIPQKSCHTRIRFNTEAALADRLIAVINTEINAIANGQISTGDVEKIQAAQLKSYEEALRKNRFWLAQITSRLQSGYGFESLYPNRYEMRVAQLTAEKLALAARKYILEAVPFKFILKPEQ